MNGYWKEKDQGRNVFDLKKFWFCILLYSYYKITNVGNSSNNIDYYFIHFHYYWFQHGVARDIYSSFRIDVSNSLFICEKERVPFLCHNFYKKEWEAIGKILAKEFNDIGYFPTTISKSFVQYCFYGDFSNTELLSSF